ncbi:major facilitator transporter [Amycolatopsis mediterranei S699]|uniref:Major facilitator transporter n=2 Tax=Amycolatopsis mediterranei TaxID=33910 RepID=A0A0H3D5D0_AMYMU|nr:MFS transporter [Amycolatopsis mediterranei]ADJ45318.1 major facilitator transporter [Amycolatopsis mediterranei U32]AEK42078.1 major facilitator transporter [Amycolatopsis mediterranei S699]AFO77029.1 major facilitator transporter [Amycolatopsis mediterranei S699]AGT84157.1 major facilitator transporter [Amycolatopsis mediterranei RB]KDO08434.1 MFS transporter [Amycolatopsis mediterranei]
MTSPTERKPRLRRFRFPVLLVATAVLLVAARGLDALVAGVPVLRLLVGVGAVLAYTWVTRRVEGRDEVAELAPAGRWAYGADAVLFTAALYATFRLPPLPAADSFGRPGLLYSSIAIGSVLAGLSSGRVRRQGVALSAAVAVWAGAVALAGLAPALWLAVTLLIVAGAADLVSAVYRQTILQTAVPDRMRGRLQGVYAVVVAGGPRLGDLRAGITASALPPAVAWSGTALVCVVLVLTGAVLVRSFWRYTP